MGFFICPDFHLLQQTNLNEDSLLNEDRKVIVLLLLVSGSSVKAQSNSDNYFTTGYNNLLSCKVVTNEDSSYAFVNYIKDSVTKRQDFGLIKTDKNGNEM